MILHAAENYHIIFMGAVRFGSMPGKWDYDENESQICKIYNHADGNADVVFYCIYSRL